MSRVTRGLTVCYPDLGVYLDLPGMTRDHWCLQTVRPWRMPCNQTR